MRKLFRAPLCVRLYLFVLMMLAGVAFAHAQFLTVTGSHLQDSSGTLISNATMSFAPVNNSNIPISFRVGTGGQAVTNAISTPVTNGAFTLALPDTSQTNPANVCFNVTVTDNVTGNSLLGAGYSCVQPSSAPAESSWCGNGVCNFDAYVPSTPALTTVTAGPTGPPGCVVGTSCTSLFSNTFVSAFMQAGATVDAKLRAAAALCPAAGCTIVLSTDAGTQFAGTFVIPSNVTVDVLPGVYYCKGGSQPAPCFATWTGSTVSNNVALVGAGEGLTIFRIPNGSTCTDTYHCNVLETHDMSDVSAAKPIAQNIYIANLTLDGNKATTSNPNGVPQPPGGLNNDLSHYGIASSGVNGFIAENVDAPGWWYSGFNFGLFSSNVTLINPSTENNGYNATTGYGGILCQGTCVNMVVKNHRSTGDVLAMWALNNVTNLSYDGTVTSPISHGLVIDANPNSGNVQTGSNIRMAVTNAGGQCASIGASAGTYTRGNHIDVTCSGGAGQQDVYIGPGSQGNHIHVLSSGAQNSGVETAGANDQINVDVINASQSGKGNNWALQLDATASNERITGRLDDTQGTNWTQRGVTILSGATGNHIDLDVTGQQSNQVNDNGTNDLIRIDQGDGYQHSPNGFRFSQDSSSVPGYLLKCASANSPTTCFGVYNVLGTGPFFTVDTAGNGFIYGNWAVGGNGSITGSLNIQTAVIAPIFQETLTTPSSSSASCTAGQFTDDASYHYVCTAANTWKRVALSSF